VSKRTTGQHIAAYYQVLQELMMEAVSSDRLRDTLATIAKKTASAMKSSGCSVLLFDAVNRRLLHAVSHGLSDWYIRKGFLNADKSLSDALEGKVVTVLDATTDRRVQYREMARRQGIASMVSVPLQQRGNIFGALRVYTREQRHFSADDIAFLTAVAGLTAVAVENAQLHELVAAIPRAGSDAISSPPDTSRLAQELIRPISFPHPSEEEFARLLDFYKIQWMYEPRSFPLEWQGDKVKDMFTPDFYLPELDLYVELTTMKQELIREKNRKVRRLKELYPEVNIKLLNKRDYHRLLAKYGYGPLGRAEASNVERILLSASQIERKVRQLGKAISHDYAGRSPLLIGILKGVVCFMSDLIRNISLPVSVDFMAISYYELQKTGSVRIIKDLDRSIAGLDVIMVEDIVDTGMTLNYVLRYLSEHNPASLEVCALLDKRVRRLVDVPLKYIGFEVPDEFVVGYGLDYNGEFRNLPFIGVVAPQSV
jgi:bifunctional protein TilS/HprT